jgi:uncharacterized membrane protein
MGKRWSELTPAQRKRRALKQQVLDALGLGALLSGGFLAFVGLFLLLFAIRTAFTGFIVWFAWNLCSLHDIFNAEPLSFLHILGVAVAINVLRSIFSRSTTVQATGKA